jgi:hypothetical protein
MSDHYSLDENIERFPIALLYPFVYENIQNLEGKILTIIDATHTDPEQRKCLKDLVRNEFGRKVEWLHKVATARVPANENRSWGNQVFHIKKKD